jgi:hypothetical protein
MPIFRKDEVQFRKKEEEINRRFFNRGNARSDRPIEYLGILAGLSLPQKYSSKSADYFAFYNIKGKL